MNAGSPGSVSVTLVGDPLPYRHRSYSGGVKPMIKLTISLAATP
jgi:hypothetical protein